MYWKVAFETACICLFETCFRLVVFVEILVSYVPPKKPGICYSKKNTRELLLAFPLKMWVTSFSVICVTAIQNKSNTRTTLPYWKYHQKLGIPNFAPACQHFTELHIVLYSPTPVTKHNQFHPPASIFRVCLVSIQAALPGSSCNPRLFGFCVPGGCRLLPGRFWTKQTPRALLNWG